MGGAGGIWDGTSDTWSSIGVAVTVRKCSCKQTARRLGCLLIAPADRAGPEEMHHANGGSPFG